MSVKNGMLLALPCVSFELGRGPALYHAISSGQLRCFILWISNRMNLHSSHTKKRRKLDRMARMLHNRPVTGSVAA